MTCSGCGHPLDLSTDPNRVLDFRAEAAWCNGCAAKERAASNREVDDRYGLRWRVVR